MEENVEKQNKKQNYGWLDAYKFVKGQSGNPNGRPPGKSLKTFAREFLEALPDDKKIEYLETLPTEIVWKMAEGNPKQDVDAKVEGTIIIEVAEEVAKKHKLIPQNDTPPNTEPSSA